ncbi:hypothetical protein T484DRAFT_1791628, partial [Baffinella frigidus]
IRERAEKLFGEFDADGSGQIDLAELRDAMAQLKVFLTDEELTHMAADMDIDGGGEIGIDEFEEMLSRMYNAKDKHGAWKMASLAICKKLGAWNLKLQLQIRGVEDWAWHLQTWISRAGAWKMASLATCKKPGAWNLEQYHLGR